MTAENTELLLPLRIRAPVISAGLILRLRLPKQVSCVSALTPTLTKTAFLLTRLRQLTESTEENPTLSETPTAIGSLSITPRQQVILLKSLRFFLFGGDPFQAVRRI